MHMIRQKTPVKLESPEGLFRLVKTGTLEHEPPVNREAVLSGLLGNPWDTSLGHNEAKAPWLEIIPRAEPSIPAEAQTLFLAQQATNRRVQAWEAVVFGALAISGAAGVGVAFWAIAHIAQ